MRYFIGLFGLVFAFSSLTARSATASSTVWLDSMDLSRMSQDFGVPHADKSITGTPITIDGKVYEHGVGTHADSVFEVNLDGKVQKFDAVVGVDDDAKGRGSVVFEVAVDGTIVADSGPIRGDEPAKTISVTLTGAKKVELIAIAGAKNLDSDHADWANARFTLSDSVTALPVQAAPMKSDLDAPGRLIITEDDPKPAIHGPEVQGCTPRYPFIGRVCATGTAPLSFSATGLPAGLKLDSSSGVISGRVSRPGTYVAVLTVRNRLGVTHRRFTIVCGQHKLALTPPMGWNSWNVWASKVDSDKVVAAAKAMVSSGLAAHGYQYVNIDDTWEDVRDLSGSIQSNSKFPDMAALTASVHALGLKAGIYSSPGPTTCAGYAASLNHEQKDANSYASWGFDYLKYDWCSYGSFDPYQSIAALKKPYVLMRTCLDKEHRDIVYSLCQYGMGNSWQWAEAIGGNCWRTNDDINDSWGSLHSIYESQNGRNVYAGPGHWNDPDMLVVGTVGWGNTHPSKLTQNEQILHISMWCMLSSPLIVGCDLSSLDPFTKAILTNDEAIAIDQDPLGKSASMITPDRDGGEVWARPLSDGSKAVALVNPYAWQTRVGVRWSELGLSKPQSVRDLWLHKDLGTFDTRYFATVPAHGCVLLDVRSHK